MINKDILAGLQHSNITNLKEGKINNQDAALIVMASSPEGFSKSGEVKEELRKWRGTERKVDYLSSDRINQGLPLAFNYLFNTCKSGGYGFVGKDFNSTSSQFYSDGRECNRLTYWYRVKPGIYRLTLIGFARMAELESQIA